MPNEDPKKSAPDDSELFREAVQDVKPLASDKISLRQPAKRVLKRSIVQPMADRLSDEFVPPCDNWLEFMRPGVQRTVFKQLEELAVLEKFGVEGLVESEANRFRLDPRQSYVPKATREKDPEFWNSK